MMTVIQRPRNEEFSSMMLDYIIDTDSTITFKVVYGERTILEEEYVPDANYQVRIRRLGKFCENALWGVWCAGEVTWQSDLSGVFKFYINDVLDSQTIVVYNRYHVASSSIYSLCSSVANKVTYPGSREFVSGWANGAYTVTAYEGETMAEVDIAVANKQAICTIDVSPDRIDAMFPDMEIERYAITMGDSSMLFYVDRTKYAEKWVIRFKNMWDVPETVTCTGGLTMKSGQEESVGMMWGVERKFSVKVTDEYSVNSGTIHLQSDYKLWYALSHSQEASILVDGEWYPILVSKQSYERKYKRSALQSVEISFRFADSLHANLIEL